MGFHILQARRRVSLSASGSFMVDKSFAKEKLRKSTLGSYLSALVTLGGTVPTRATWDRVQEMKVGGSLSRTHAFHIRRLETGQRRCSLFLACPSLLASAFTSGIYYGGLSALGFQGLTTRT